MFRLKKKYGDQIISINYSDQPLLGNHCINVLKCFTFTTLQQMLYNVCENIYSLKPDKITYTISKSMVHIYPLVDNTSII